ncbi:hypothetical protein EDI_167720 [Entamoeba dispar SAW760]|uniref:Uncharacterized protein n=1 Tax=Entamoeba dispar (strain ATCC PRA-260 / SAW760) TaxID=370354 RepID=B0EP38_ENTDS|nr:uncharacterized protein EDI_167720 [Entamoeba dispar SAW760]EDR23713.1 hypothetical protein EDI_167720 [Entamoeba dispar SAW760]|eukprot:EDR23713.1 hypothetical protein EDI_167720 [Entamoeba dispar SAW760]
MNSSQHLINSKMFDSKESYSNRLKMFLQFISKEGEFNESELNFVKQNSPMYYKILSEASEKISKSKKPKDIEQEVLLRSFSVTVEIFGKMAFKQITEQKYFDVWKTYLCITTETKIRIIAFEGLVKGIISMALKAEEWSNYFFNCLDLESIKNKEESIIKDNNGNSRYELSTRFLELFLTKIIRNDETLISVFPLFRKIIEILYVQKTENTHVDDIAHEEILKVLNEFKFSNIVYLTRYKNMIEYLEKVIEEICYKVLSGDQTTEKFVINITAYKKLIEHYIIGPYSPDLAIYVGKKGDPNNENIISIEPNKLKEFQKKLIKGIEIMLINLKDGNQNNVMSIITEIKRIYNLFIERSSTINYELKKLICFISRSVMWRTEFVESTQKIRRSTFGSFELQLTKAADFAISSLSLWILFMRDKKEWDIFLQKMIALYPIKIFYKEIRKIFLAVTQMIINLYYKINFKEINEKKINKDKNEINDNKLIIFQLENMNQNDLLFFWKELIQIACNGIAICQNEALTEWTITIKKVMEYLIYAEEITEKKGPINIHEEFAPIFISILNEQKYENTIKTAINGLNEIIIRPIRYEKSIYEVYSIIIQSILKFNNQICISIFPTINKIFLYDLPLEELIQPLLENMIKYQNNNYSEEIEFQTLKLLLSISIYEEQHYYKNKNFEYIKYISLCYQTFLNNFITTQIKNIVLWSIGVTIVLNERKHKNEKNYKILLDIILQFIKEQKILNNESLKVIIFITRQLGGITPWYLEYICSFLIKIILEEKKENEQKKIILFAIIEIIQSNIMFSLKLNIELIELINKIINIDMGELNELIEIIASLLFKSMGHERLSENINSLSKETTWWGNRTSIISITPQQGGEITEIGIRDPTGSWRFLVKPWEIKEIQKEEIKIKQPKIEIEEYNEFKEKTSIKESILSKKLNKKQLEELEWKEPINNHEQQINLNEKNFNNVQKYMNEIQKNTQTIILTENKEKSEIKKWYGYILNSFLQYPKNNEIIINSINITSKINEMIKEIDFNGMNQLIPLRIFGNEEDPSYKALYNTLVDKNNKSSLGIFKTLQIEKETTESKLIIIWGKDINQYKPKCINAEIIIQLIPKGNLIVVHIIDSILKNLTGPLIDNMVVESEVIISFIKETVLAIEYSMDQNLIFKRMKIIKEIQKSSKTDCKMSTYYTNASNLFTL